MIYTIVSLVSFCAAGFISGWMARDLYIFIKNKKRKKVIKIICSGCEKFITGAYLICKISEGKHKGMFVYYHKKCAEKYLKKVPKKKNGKREKKIDKL